MHSLDIKRKQRTKSQIIGIRLRAVPSSPASPRQKSLKLNSYFNSKQVATIIITFVLTFVFSLATSQGLAKINNSNPQDNSAILQGPASTTNTLAVTNIPDTLSMDNKIVTDPTKIYLPIEQIDLPDPLHDRKDFLKKYLASKHSVLADHVDVLSEQTQWKLIIAISRAESSFCKKHALNNCWGIGGAWNLKKYDNYDQAISDVNRILEQHYIAAGLSSPAQIVNKWVGHPSDNWEEAVNEELAALQNVN